MMRDFIPHESIRRWLFNPATLVTVAGPTVADMCLWFFVASSGGQYALLAKNPNVCALIEHRTQLYTLIVAYCFLVIELAFGGWGANKRIASHWRYTLTILLGAAIVWSALGGYLMSESVVNLYKAGSCSLGVPSPGDPPPYGSPITWLRVSIFLIIAVLTFIEKPPSHGLSSEKVDASN